MFSCVAMDESGAPRFPFDLLWLLLVLLFAAPGPGDELF